MDNVKGILLTGSHPRHLYLADQLHRSGLIGGLVIERRAAFVPSPPPGLQPVDEANFIRHFRDREAAELRFFGPAEQYRFEGLEICHVTRDELNSPRVRDWVAARKPDFVITYGVHKISNEMLEGFPPIAWNVHGGLSPWYRGAITLFWPFYFLQPNWAGMTIHRLTSKLDGGEIIHHSVPNLERGDGIHDTACRAVLQAAEDLTAILRMIEDGKQPEAVPQKSSGKLFLAKDWRPEHLRLIYNLFNNDIVDHYLDGKLSHTEPPLVRAF